MEQDVKTIALEILVSLKEKKLTYEEVELVLREVSYQAQKSQII